MAISIIYTLICCLQFFYNIFPLNPEIYRPWNEQSPWPLSKHAHFTSFLNTKFLTSFFLFVRKSLRSYIRVKLFQNLLKFYEMWPYRRNLKQFTTFYDGAMMNFSCHKNWTSFFPWFEVFLSFIYVPMYYFKYMRAIATVPYRAGYLPTTNMMKVTL